MKTLITGSNGFVGMNLAVRMLELGHSVIFCFRSRFPESYMEMLKKYGNRVEYSQGDLMDKDYYTELEKLDFDSIINAAMVTATGLTELEAFAFEAETNIVCHIRLLDLARRKNIMRFTYISSSGIYGEIDDGHVIVNEDGHKGNAGVYGITKIASEQLLSKYADLTGAKCASCRVPSVYGPFERVTASRIRMSQAYALARMAVNGQEAVIYGKDRMRDWTYADDVAAAVCAVHTCENLSYDVYNIATGLNHTIEDLAKAAQKAVPSFRYRFTDNESEANVVSKSTQPRLSIDRLVQDTGFKAQYGLDAGMKKYIELIKSGQEA